jgi:hypothetical protein
MFQLCLVKVRIEFFVEINEVYRIDITTNPRLAKGNFKSSYLMLVLPLFRMNITKALHSCFALHSFVSISVDSDTTGSKI